MLYRFNTDIQSLRAGFYGGGSNITALAENRYRRCQAHVTGSSRDLKIVYNSDQRCRSSPFLSLALDSRL